MPIFLSSAINMIRGDMLLSKWKKPSFSFSVLLGDRYSAGQMNPNPSLVSFHFSISNITAGLADAKDTGDEEQ